MNTGVAKPRLTLPDVPVLTVGLKGAVLLSPDGEVKDLAFAEAVRELRQLRPMVCHMPSVAARLRCPPFRAHDLLELFAFVRPARFCLPTARGLAVALQMEEPLTHEEEAQLLVNAARRLLSELPHLPGRDQANAASIAWAMGRGGWTWGPSVFAALGLSAEGPHRATVAAGLKVWEKLPKWEERPPEPPPGNLSVESPEARARLTKLLGSGAEERPQQADYASAVCAAFAPRDHAGAPNVVLAEAGTGVGKTLGYIAPASLWAEKNEGTAWISTYTRNLQRQLDMELDRLYPDPTEKARRVVVRKGRENYLCLLNLEEAVQRLHTNPQEAVPLGLMARWALASRDGDMVGGDFPAWLTDILGHNATMSLTDRRGECIYSACSHYQVCFIERTVRKARRAEVVVANHALVMAQAALGGLSEDAMPLRIVFDEAHHVFSAADSAFSAHLSGMEAAELRRWLLGAEGEGTRSRARGLKNRAEDLLGEAEEGPPALAEVMGAARVLPGPGWNARLSAGSPHGPTEIFLAHVRQQVLARAHERDVRAPYSLECEASPPVPGLAEAANRLDAALQSMVLPLKALSKVLARRLGEEADELESNERQRIESLLKSLERRALLPLAAWRSMLQSMSAETPPEFVDWLGIERYDGREIDVGLHRHWIDPTVPFVAAVAEHAHGLLLTSATLRDGTGDTEADWFAAEQRTGCSHLPLPAVRAQVPSPFDYAKATRVLVVTDVRRDDPEQVAAAYRELFLASGGGALGIFTAISRLRGVHRRIGGALEDAGLPLHAQHVDGVDTGTLVDIFRAEEHSCLLGTDAMRDGVDVPGASLRLLVFDRVPWPRPDIIHKARRAAFGGKAYEDMIARLRLKQAFGRLIRRAGDRGVFVLLDPMLPSRLHGAFPEGVVVERVGIREAVETVRGMLSAPNAPIPRPF